MQSGAAERSFAMRGPADNLPASPHGPSANLFGGLLIPFFGLAVMEGVWALFRSLLV
jgi:hypothetical protein